jgi:phosphatidylinositol transfer protein SFH5
MSAATPADLNPTPKPAEETEPAGSDDNEPQNALTQKFTEKEWAALKEFRVCATIYPPSFFNLQSHNRILPQSLLPDILGEAYDGKEGARTTPIVIWGVTLDPNGKSSARASVVLMKWLRARCVPPKCIPVSLHIFLQTHG